MNEIRRLSAVLEEQKGIVKRLMDEMQFYKLELVNREQNYNKVFGVQPTVGIMNPIAKKPGGTRINGGLPPLGTMVAPGPGKLKRSSERRGE